MLLVDVIAVPDPLRTMRAFLDVAECQGPPLNAAQANVLCDSFALRAPLAGYAMHLTPWVSEN